MASGKSKNNRGKPKPKSNRKAASAAVAAARKTNQRNRYFWTGGGVAVIVALIVVLAVALNQHKTQNPGPAAAPTEVPATPISTAVGRTSAPPWNVPSDVTAEVHKAGLPMLGSEGTTEHIHVHLDILNNGQPVTVPQYVGIDEAGGSISPLHTHDTTGVIHIESPKVSTFTLGQFFTEWNVTLDANHLGGLAAGNGNTLRAYVNGKLVSGDPAAIVFHAHDEIALVYGPADAKVNVPSSYQWTNGL